MRIYLVSPGKVVVIKLDMPDDLNGSFPRSAVLGMQHTHAAKRYIFAFQVLLTS